MKERLGKYSRATLYVFACVIVVVVCVGVVLELWQVEGESKFYGGLPVEYTELSSVGGELRAVVEGSVYESGENMTVFGACLTGDGELVPEASAELIAWYPNGSVFVPATSAVPILSNVSDGNSTTGRFRVHVTMDDVLGTYFTQLNCTVVRPGPDEHAITFGEWQNPVWVKRIGDVQLSVLNVSDVVNVHTGQLANISSALDNFSVETSSALGGVASVTDVRELRELVHSVSTSLWVIDVENPTYSLSSGVFNYEAVDMAGPRNLHAVSTDGRAVFWDGSTWTERNISGMSAFGVSALQSGLVYAWYAGSNVSNNVSVYSVNGGEFQTVPGAGGTSFTDVKVFPPPNVPLSDVYAYVMTNDGEIWLSVDGGDSWSLVHDTGEVATRGRISDVVENTEENVTEGYRVLFGQGSTVSFFNGSSFVDVSGFVGEVRDVELLYGDEGWVVTHDGVNSRVYVWNGSGLSLDFVAEGVVLQGVDGTSGDDVWVVTADPSVFYHFDGRAWEFERFAFSAFGGVTVSFGPSVTVSFVNVSSADVAFGLRDMVLWNSKVGYAVGADGLIMELQSHHDVRFDEVLDALNGTVDVNFSEVLEVVRAVNGSLQSSIGNVSEKVEQLNASLSVKLEQVLANQSLIQLVLGDVNASVTEVLVRLGVLEEQVNLSVVLSNQTLQIVNESAGDIDELVGRSRRIRPWITP